MACNCKTAKRKNGKIKLEHNITKKGTKYYLSLIGDIILGRVFMPLFLGVICLILFPIATVILMATQILTGEAKMLLPKHTIKKLKKIEDNGEQLQNKN